jgi:hypothetical protein
MRKNKVECDVFYYKGSYLIEQPQETKIYNRRYVDDIGLVAYCKKRSLLIEIICTLVILLNVFSLIVYPTLSTRIYIPEYINCYDGKLYTNIVSDENNKNRVTLDILGTKYVVEPGDRVYSISTDKVYDSVDISIKSSFLLFSQNKLYTVPVNNLYQEE